MNPICKIRGCKNHVEKGTHFCKYHSTEMKRFQNRVSHGTKSLVKVCSVEGCGRIAKTKGLCSTHYNQKWKNERISKPNTCIVDGCDKPAVTKGMCATHYNQMYRATKAGRDINIPLKKNHMEPIRICSIPGCEEKHKAKGLCDKHYKQTYNKKNASNRNRKAVLVNAASIKCIVHGCESRVESRGLCVAHTYRIRKHGVSDPVKYKQLFGEDIKLTGVEMLKAPQRLQPVDQSLAIAYYGEILEKLSQYKHVLRIAREMFQNGNKMTAIDLGRYNDVNKVIISETLYAMHYKFNMGLIPFWEDKDIK